MFQRSAPAVLALLALAACNAFEPAAPSEIGVWRDETIGIERRELRQVSQMFWDGWLSWHPVEASALGDPGQLGRWPSTVEAVRGAWAQGVWEVQTAQALIERRHLTPEDKLTYDLLAEALRRESGLLKHELDRFWLDPVDGPQMRFLAAVRRQPTETPRQREQFLARWKAFARSIEALERDAVARAAMGFVAPRSAIERNLVQLDALLGLPTLQSPLLAPASGDGRWIDVAPDESLATIAQRELGDPLKQADLVALNPHLLDPAIRARGTKLLLPNPSDPVSPADRGRFLEQVRLVIEAELVPALTSWRDTLAFRLATRAPTNERPGLIALPGGTGIYRDLAWLHTTTRLSPESLSDLAQEQLTALEDELYTTAAKVLRTADRERLRGLLRGDPALFHGSAAEVESALRSDLARATAATRGLFLDHNPVPLLVGLRERADRGLGEPVVYVPASANGARPARLLVDVGADRQPRYATAAIAFGEGLPGRHYLRGLLRERPDLPLFRRHVASEALELGWADYAEELAEELGLYEDDMERVGRLARAALRRARAVAEVGLHLQGWSRTRAVEFLREHSFAGPAEVEFEVDLLVARPGVALAPVAAATVLARLRSASEASLGAQFQLANFHEVITAEGALDLPNLARLVGLWGGFDGVSAAGLAPQQ